MDHAIQKRTEDFHAFLLSLQDTLGVVVGDDRYLEITDKLDPVMTVHGIESLDILAERLRDNSAVELRTSVLQEITSPRSVWFGQSEVTSLMTDYVLPDLDKQNLENFRI